MKQNIDPTMNYVWAIVIAAVGIIIGWNIFLFIVAGGLAIGTFIRNRDAERKAASEKK